MNTVNGANGTTGFANRHVRLLLEHGVDPELHGTRRPFYDGRTSSVEAASSGHPDVVEPLRNAGAATANKCPSRARNAT